jgi:DNA-binding beta-propeller fold protein YncE
MPTRHPSRITLRSVLPLAALLLVAGCQPAAQHSHKSPSPAEDGPAADADATPRRVSGAGRLEVGPRADGGSVVPTAQLIRPAGETIEFPGRPVDMTLSDDGTRLFVKDNTGLIVIDVNAWAITQTLRFPKKNDGGSMVGIAAGPGGNAILTTADGELVIAGPKPDGAMAWERQIPLKGKVKGTSFPCGVAITADGAFAYVCLSRDNTLVRVDLERGVIERSIDVGVAPYEVKLSTDGTRAYVSNWGGRHPEKGERSALSSGTLALVDDRGVATSGTVTEIDLASWKVVREVEVGRSASAVAILDSAVVAVTASNDDRLVLVRGEERRVFSTRPDEALPFGSMPNGLVQVPRDSSSLGGKVLVANAGNNALTVMDPASGEIAGLIPTAWYPGPVAVSRTHAFVGCINGVGSRTPRKDQKGWNSHWHRGTISRVKLPDASELRAYTTQARADARLPQTLKAMERAGSEAKAVPVPVRAGQKSVFEHVVYIIKENRTFDQVFGDFAQANSDPSLCIFGREVTPNQHALAERFGILDNFYCNGVLSADGHSWATEGISTPYLQRSFGGFERSYTFGDDPLTYSSGGFVWDMVLARGFSFRNYGEFNETGIEPRATFFQVYEDLKTGGGKYRFTHSIGVENVRRFSCPDAPGWNMAIPDQYRADVFLREFAGYEASGDWPNFITIYLPNDHTNGVSQEAPTPRAMVADNDLAVGRIVEAITRSRYWDTTCIFVVEDDPQNGFDHVDGHRSTCLVISPYSKRGKVISNFYNQASVVHTIGRIFGASAPNQLAAMAPVMAECFTLVRDAEPFTHLPSNIPLDERSPAKAELTGPGGPTLAAATATLNFALPDRADEDTLNRIVWHSVKGAQAYPTAWAGAHGRGLKPLGLSLATGALKPVDDDDDDDDDDD